MICYQKRGTLVIGTLVYTNMFYNLHHAYFHARWGFVQKRQVTKVILRMYIKHRSNFHNKLGLSSLHGTL